jgi:hypothetical protein
MNADDGNTEAHRGTRDVLDAHLKRRQVGDLDGDIRENYHPDVVLLSAEGVHHGTAELRALAGVLRRYLPHGDYRYRQVLTRGRVGMLVWSGRCADTDTEVHDGVDSYVIQDGRIVAQTIHYSAAPLSEHPE